MKKHFTLFLVGCLLAVQNSLAQQMASLNGIITNLRDEPLEDVIVFIHGKDTLKVTDKKGFFSFQLPYQQHQY